MPITKDKEEMFGEMLYQFENLTDAVTDNRKLKEMTGRINHAKIEDLKNMVNKFYSLVTQLERESR